tara:strand:+ start:502 stop:702 length:201 start_codon:yes stop_codon:yes gene_type:complete
LKQIEKGKIQRKAYDSEPNPGNRLVIRKIKRDMQSMYMQDDEGNQITYEEWEYRLKYIPYKQYQWP